MEPAARKAPRIKARRQHVFWITRLSEIENCSSISISALNSLAAFRIRIASSWFNTATVYVRLPFENVPCLIETSTSILNAFFNKVNEIKNELSNLEISKEDFERKKKTLISSLIYVSDNIFSINRTLMNDIIKYNFIRTNRYKEIKKLNFKDFNNLISNTDYSNISELIIEPKEQ